MSLDNPTREEVEIWTKGLADALKLVELNGLYRCPECTHLIGTPPNNYNICPHCLVEFGNDAPEQQGEKLWPL